MVGRERYAFEKSNDQLEHGKHPRLRFRTAWRRPLVKY
jgi:hypothetical protein